MCDCFMTWKHCPHYSKVCKLELEISFIHILTMYNVFEF